MIWLIIMEDGNGVVEVELIVSLISGYSILGSKVLNSIRNVSTFTSGFQKLEESIKKMYMNGILSISNTN